MESITYLVPVARLNWRIIGLESRFIIFGRRFGQVGSEDEENIDIFA